MKTIKAFDIVYDTDNLAIHLPKELIFHVDDDFDPEQEIADLISDHTGWCVKSCNYEKIVKVKNETEISIFDFVEQQKDSGYGLALVDADTEIVIDPYVDPSDYPTITFPRCCSGVTSTCGKYKIVYHSGCLEENKNYFVEFANSH